MLKKLVDTNIFIDRFIDTNRYKEIFLSDGLVYLSSIVMMELRAGAHTRSALKAVNAFFDHFKRVERIINPSPGDYEKAGGIIAKLQIEKGYNIKKSASITNDCILAAAARSTGATIYTQNKKDFQAILDVFNYKVVFV